jgi:regulator of protease activity HflC (stomatin/prohibitin superfamily)
MQPKNSTFSDRQAASVAAKKALLEKFKPKPMIQAEAPINHEAERLAKLEAIRAQRQAEKEARQRAREEAEAAAEQARIEAEAAAERARLEAEHLSDAQKRAERKERKKAVKEAARMKKEQRAATRPSGPREERVLDPYEEHRRYIASLERGRERRRA